MADKPSSVLDGRRINQFRVSPNGKWVAYTTQETGVPEIWVAAFPSFTGRRKVAVGAAPVWRADGKALLLIGRVPPLESSLASVAVDTEAAFEASPLKLLFKWPTGFLGATSIHAYALTNNGQRLLVRDVSGIEGTDQDPLYFLMNWPSLSGK